MFRSAVTACLLAATTTGALAATDTGEAVDLSLYADRELLPDPFAPACENTPRTLEQISGNLYRHTNTAFPALHSGLVLVTDEGALVIDTALTCTTEWLRDEIQERFGVGIAYVVYTHAHFDHIAGSQILQDEGTIVVAQRNAIKRIVDEKLPVAIPDRVFDREMTITLGGETVELHHIAPSHSNNMTLVHFPAQRALQCTDICQSQTMPYMDFMDFYYDGWIESLDWVIEQDVDLIDVGHYSPATVQDQVALREYLTGLHDQIGDQIRAGKTWDQTWRAVRYTDEQREWFGFDAMRFANIVGMHRWVVHHRRGTW